MDKIPMTAGGFQALTEELRHRQQVERQRIIQAIAEVMDAAAMPKEAAEQHC